MASHERPESVQKARIEGNKSALSAMGKKGGEKAADNRAIRETLRAEDLKNLTDEQAKLYSISPEGDVLPPSPH